jgi:uracil-DNA glycosylase
MWNDVKIEESWKNQLKDEIGQPYFDELRNFLSSERQNGHIIYPSENEIFSSFNLTPFDQVKVVIIGQDPYHGSGQAHGLAFSVNNDQTLPPSLRNIFKELETDLNLTFSRHGNLTNWARQGVLLLNATLTVRSGNPGSHQNKGWERFTDAVISIVSKNKTGIVFILWGKFAQEKEKLIDTTRHFILKAAHPSPFSAYRGFFGSNHFSKTNELLIAQGKQPIDWSVNANE